jgi:hypothetical protein
MPAISDQHEEIKSVAERLYAAKSGWIMFYREIFGLRGMIRRHFPTMEAMAQFEQTNTYREIQRMLAELRRRNPGRRDPATEDFVDELGEVTKVITVRIPQSLHDALKIEAYEHRTSINKLCISKLLQYVDADHVPSAFEETTEGEKKAEAGL